MKPAISHPITWSQIARLSAPLVWIDAQLEAERHRLILWVPVAFGAGIAVYMTLVREPNPLTLAITALLALILLFLPRFSLSWRVMAGAAAGICFGLLYGQWTVMRVAAPVLNRPLDGVLMTGRVVEILPLERGGARLIMRPQTIDHWPGPMAHMVRVNLRHLPEDISPGDQVQLRAGLMPPPHPLVPGGYDVARSLWFARIGAVGFAFGAPVKLPDQNAEQSVLDDFRETIQRLRHEISRRIQAALPGAAGGVANALLTGIKGNIPEVTVTQLRDAGLAHLLVVAGMHMGFVCGIVFLVIRGGLALIPSIALRYPIKKWAAAGSILICFLYLLLTGSGAPTQRAFVMISIVMMAVILDRRALSMRLLAISALVVMVIAPDVVIGPGFQMSFAAVAALIAAAESALARKLPSLGEGPLASAGDHIVAIGLTTVIASIATEPFAAFHFDHIALYSIPANMIAVPITAVWNMPWGLLALIAMPFGCEGPFLTMMGLGIGLVIEVAKFLTALPDAIIQLPAMPGVSLALLAVGLAWICLWQQNWRWAGIMPILGAFGLWSAASLPDLIIDPSAKTIAIRAEDGRLKFLPGRPKSAPAESWMERDGAGRQSELPMAGPGDHITCDAMGCIWRRADHVVVAISRHKLAQIDDCRLADLVISAERLEHCASARAVIDRQVLQELGAHSVRFSGNDWLIETAIAPGTNRPWVKARRLSAMRGDANDEDEATDDDDSDQQSPANP